MAGNQNSGRTKGAKNKSSELVKIAVVKFLEANVDKFSGWLDKIEQDHGPLEAFKCVTGLLEYHLPKQARVEHEGNIDHRIDRVEIVRKEIPTLENKEDTIEGEIIH